jgi:hypothetical protein
MSVDPQKARAIFLEAVEKHTPDHWSNFLDELPAPQHAVVSH